MFIKYIVVLTVAIMGVGSLTIFGSELSLAISRDVVSKGVASNTSAQPKLGMHSMAGLIPVGAAMRVIRTMPSLRGKFGFRNATNALVVMTDQKLVRGSATHALRVHKIEQPSGAWRAALPGYAAAASDAGRRGVGTEMFNGRIFDVESHFFSQIFGGSSLKDFAENSRFITPKVQFESMFGTLRSGGKTKKISLRQRAQRLTVRRATTHLSNGGTDWTEINRFSASVVDDNRHMRLTSSNRRFRDIPNNNENPVLSIREHYLRSLEGGVNAPDITATREAIHVAISKEITAYERNILPNLTDLEGQWWTDQNAFYKTRKPGHNNSFSRTMNFDEINVQHAALPNETARVTVLKSESGIQRLVVKIAPGFKPSDDFGPWLVQSLEQYRQAHPQSTPTTEFVFRR